MNIFFMDCSEKFSNTFNAETLESHMVGSRLLELLGCGKETSKLLKEKNKKKPVLGSCKTILDNLKNFQNQRTLFILIPSDKEEDCYSNRVVETIRYTKPIDPILKLTSGSSECRYYPKEFILSIPIGFILDERKHDKLAELLDFLIFPPRIYISYGNKGEKNIDDYIEKIKLSFRKVFPHIEIFHDKSIIDHGDYIDHFIQDLKEANYLIALMNERYFSSIDCMDEFAGFLDKSGQIDIFRKRFISIVMENAQSNLNSTAQIRKNWIDTLLGDVNCIKEYGVDKKLLKKIKIIVRILDELLDVFDNHIFTRRNASEIELLNNKFLPIINIINREVNTQGFMTFYSSENDIQNKNNIGSILSDSFSGYLIVKISENN